MKNALMIILGILCISAAAVSEQKDAKGCEDYPLFTRMPGYWIHNCDVKEFNSFAFVTGTGTKQEVEGRYWKIAFYPQATMTSKPSELQILRNFENALAKLGGKVVRKDKSRETMTLTQNGKEIWIEVWAEFTGKYGYTIVEKAAMQQDITANAAALANDLTASGHSAVYGIYFDTGKSDLKPESDQAIGEIAKLMNNDAGLKLYIVGHTDNVGGVESNMALSEKRTNAVIQALVKGHGIAAARLKGFGNGPFAPVSTNETDDGRAKNRRVEIVKQ